MLRLHPVTLWRMERDGQFVARVRRSSRLTGFMRSEVIAWMRARPRGLHEPVCVGKTAAA